MDIAQFAETHSVRTRRDECGEVFVPGKRWKVQPIPKFRPARELYTYGHQIYDHGDGRFGVMLMFPVDNGKEIGGSGKSAKWGNARKKLLAAGFTLKQNGDAEGACLFNPSNKAQAKLALKLAGVKQRRVSNMTPEQRKAVAERLAASRSAIAT